MFNSTDSVGLNSCSATPAVKARATSLGFRARSKMEELIPAVRPNSEPHMVARESEDWSPGLVDPTLHYGDCEITEAYETHGN